MPYLDHAASSPMRAGAIVALLPYLEDQFANPSGGHAASRKAKTALEEARETVAQEMGARPREIVFTGGGTEADNLAVRGGALAARAAGRGHRVITTAVEHKAVLAPARRLAHEGFEVVEVGVDHDGRLDLDAFTRVCNDDTALVSVMLVNNEVGTVQPLAEVIEITRRQAPHAVVHTDAVQAVPWLDTRAATLGCDLVSISAHKFGGPKGAGVLVVREGVDLVPLIEGGGQEFGLRGGTVNVAGAVGTATALAENNARREHDVPRVAARRDRFVAAITDRVPGSRGNGFGAPKIAGNAHMSFEGINAEALLVLLDRGGVYATAGSACSSGAIESSHVLAAMGMSEAEARSSVRFSLGHTTSDADIDASIDVVVAAVEQMRSVVKTR